MFLLTIAAAAAALAAEPGPIRLTRPGSLQAELAGGGTQEVRIPLRAGQSAELVVEQQGIDVAVDLFAPGGTLLDSIDSPNGRQGPEPVSLHARAGGEFRLRIRALAEDEPRGRIDIRLVAVRSIAETRTLFAERRRAREAAARWIGRQIAPLPADGRIAADDPLPPFDRLAEEAIVVGLGEASHGSRELNDVRLALVQRLVVRHGYRLIALEDSATRWRALEDHVAGRSAEPAAPTEWGWIGRRSRHALLLWVRQWNAQHPGDPVRILGVDAQDNGPDRERLGAYLARAYGEAAATAWAPHAAELAAADEQTAVFGDSGTSAGLRQFLQDAVAQLTADGPLLRARFGAQDHRAALEAALTLAAFADFNAGASALGHSRDWHMATALLRAMGDGPGRPKAIYWGHNSHVSAAATRWGPTGGLLRQALGCGYRAVATTFGAGAFIAQIPSDPADRIVPSALPEADADADTIETMLGAVRPGAHLGAWRCGEAADAPPQWLAVDRPLRWIGGLWAPDSLPSASYRPYRLTAAFDAILFFPTVTAEAVPTDRPIVPPRQRGAAPSAR